MKCPFLNLAGAIPAFIGMAILVAVLFAVLGHAAFIVLLVAFVLAYRRGMAAKQPEIK